VHLRVMTVTHLNRPRTRIVGVDVMVVDQPSARAGGVTEQNMDDALSAREFAPPLGVVDRSFHAAVPFPTPHRTSRNGRESVLARQKWGEVEPLTAA
jgi:hypothetical protein